MPIIGGKILADGAGCSEIGLRVRNYHLCAKRNGSIFYDINMSGKYRKLKSNDLLINIVSTEKTYHTEHPKTSVVDVFQAGFMDAVQKYGVNVQVTPADIYESIGDQSSIFHDNFCGGVNGIISYGEKEVRNRFVEAIEKAGDSFDNKLKKGLEAFFVSDPHSKYNTYDGQSFNMKTRTRFCVEICRPKYWQIIITPLVHAIDDYIAEYYPKWVSMPADERKFAYILFADVLRGIAGEITEMNSCDIFEQSKTVKLYVKIFKKQILAIAWAMFDETDKSKTAFGGKL